MKSNIKSIKCVVLLTLIISMIFLSSCSDSQEENKRVWYDSETMLTFNEETESYIKNLSPSEDIYVVFFTERYIDSLNVAIRADKLFDDFAKKCKGFDKNGIAIIMSIEPQLIQVRVGTNYSYYLKMKGVTSGHGYIEMQEAIAKRGLDAMIPVFTENTLNAIKEYKESSWFTKFKVTLGTSWVGDRLYNLATPSDSLFGKISANIVRVIAYIMGVGGSWFLSLLLITSFVFLLNKLIDYRYNKKNDTEVGKIIFTNYAKIDSGAFWLKFLVGLLVGIPSIATLTILSNARTEDAIMLQQANIPHLELMDWANHNYSQTPSISLLLIFAVIVYLSYIMAPGRMVTMAGLRDNIQRHLFSTNEQLKKDCKELYTHRKLELNILIGVIILILIVIPLCVILFRVINWFAGLIIPAFGYVAKLIFGDHGGSGVGDVVEHSTSSTHDAETINSDSDDTMASSIDEISSSESELSVVPPVIDAESPHFGSTEMLLAGVVVGSAVQDQPSADFPICPMSALLKKISRGGLFYSTCLTVIAGEIFSTPIVIYIAIFLVLQSLWNLYNEYKFYNNVKEIYRNYTAMSPCSYWWLMKSEWGYYILSLFVVFSLLFWGKDKQTGDFPYRIPEVVVTERKVVNDQYGLDGTYYIRKANGVQEEGSMAVVKSENERDYIMTIYSDEITKTVGFRYDPDTESVFSKELGKGNVVVKKSINQIKINFETGWTIVR